MSKCSPWCKEDYHIDAEDTRLRDFQPLKSDGIDYSGTDHRSYGFTSEGFVKFSPGWADIVSGKCKCIQCEYARFKHNVKQMINREKKRVQDG